MSDDLNTTQKRNWLIRKEQILELNDFKKIYVSPKVKENGDLNNSMDEIKTFNVSMPVPKITMDSGSPREEPSEEFKLKTTGNNLLLDTPKNITLKKRRDSNNKGMETIEKDYLRLKIELLNKVKPTEPLPSPKVNNGSRISIKMRNDRGSLRKGNLVTSLFKKKSSTDDPFSSEMVEKLKEIGLHLDNDHNSVSMEEDIESDQNNTASPNERIKSKMTKLADQISLLLGLLKESDSDRDSLKKQNQVLRSENEHLKVEIGKIKNLTKVVSKQNIMLEKSLKEVKDQQQKEKKKVEKKVMGHKRRDSKGFGLFLTSPRRSIKDDKNIKKKGRIRTVGDFEIKSLLGRGAYGEVFLAKEISTNNVYAIKRMSKQFIVESNQVRSIKTEAEVLQQASEDDSNWIVRLNYSFSTNNYLFLAMQFCSGGDLRSLIDNLELHENFARFYCAEMIMAVNSLHIFGFVHRDLKPDNFLISSDGHLKLADFGLSKDNGLIKSDNKTPRKRSATYKAPTYVKVFLEDGNFEMCGLTSDTQVEQLLVSLRKRLGIPNNEKCYVIDSNLKDKKRTNLKKKDKPLAIAKKWKNPNHHQFLFRKGENKKQILSRNSNISESPKVGNNNNSNNESPKKLGSSSFFEEDFFNREKFFSVVGSPNYMAAEMLEGSGYEQVVDWWSVGCILYEMVLGYPIFRGETAEEVFLSIMNFSGKIEWQENEVQQLSEATRDCISSFLQPAKKRLGYNGVEEIKNHKFFSFIKWGDLINMKPPFVPQLEDEYDTSCFPNEQQFQNFVLDGDVNSEKKFEGEDPFTEWDWSQCEKDSK
eukprot:TRINITY_DN1590_c0_g1_i1.p1 TRINITY_DN1590_c0_g1~~TRINITY_DN1590_c0_g1_i1.p1  ORF type:complete len:814 (+),score=263.89 TRINITY_DN1590_c0_g1_i1:82-2523(+)